MQTINDACLVILAGRGCNEFLEEWSQRFAVKWIMKIKFTDHVAAMRNTALKWFLHERTEPWLVMMDDDIVPLPETEEFIAATGDVVGARNCSRGGNESHRQSLDMAALKIHRRVVEKIAPPWCQFTYTDDGVDVRRCECLFFFRKVIDAGFRVDKAGKVGHRFPVTVVPGDSGPTFMLDDAVRKILGIDP